MHQMGVKRKTADDKPLCFECVHDENCSIKPEWKWNYVLFKCQKFIEDKPNE